MKRVLVEGASGFVGDHLVKSEYNQLRPDNFNCFEHSAYPAAPTASKLRAEVAVSQAECAREQLSIRHIPGARGFRETNSDNRIR
jgi:hypothetical protein